MWAVKKIPQAIDFEMRSPPGLPCGPTDFKVQQTPSRHLGQVR
jgi:hypothetical protein